MLRILISCLFSGFLLFAFFAVQEWRDPDVDPHYIGAFYHNTTQVWERNGYLALQGLNAPEGVEDFYAYGQQKVLEAFIRQQDLKKFLDVSIPPLYTLPDIQPDAALLALPDDSSLNIEIEDEQYSSVSCLYPEPGEEEKYKTQNCLPSEQFHKNIADNALLWKRFNMLPDYALFSVIPFGIEGFYSGQDLIKLNHWKNTEILETAKSGDPERAFQEWYRFKKWAQSLTHAHDTAVWKAIAMVIEGHYYTTYTKLLYYHPDLAAQHESEIKEVFSLRNLVHDGSHLFADDWPQVEEAMLTAYNSQVEEYGMKAAKAMMPTGDFRNRFYQCIKNQEEYLKTLPESIFSFEDFKKNCAANFPDFEDNIAGGMFESAFIMTGSPISNIVHGLLLDGLYSGGRLMETMYHNNGKAAMALLAARIVQERTPSAEIPLLIEQESGSLKEAGWIIPILWDSEKKRLYYKDLDGLDRSLYVPVQ